MEDEPSRSPWDNGRIDARAGPGQLLFGRMYEDATIELRLFPPGGRIFCIASAGCTAFELSRQHDVVAVDINPVQIEYVKQRIAGAAPRQGRVDRGLSFLRGCAPAVGWSARKLDVFFEFEDPVAQASYWRRHLDTARFRLALDLVLSPALIRLAYARPFLRILPPQFGRVLGSRLDRCFARHANRRNPHARALLAGDAAPVAAPAEARNIHLVHADAVAFLEREPAASFDGFTLSNILDGASDAYAARLRRAVERAARPGAGVLLRSFAEPREAADAERAAEDRSMIWGSVEVRRA